MSFIKDESFGKRLRGPVNRRLAVSSGDETRNSRFSLLKSKIENPKPRMLVLLTSLLLLLSPALEADENLLPAGGRIVAGAGTISQAGNTLIITQATDKLIANWQGFSIGEGGSVIFNQPGATSLALNRVLGQDPSRILGNLSANGQVFLLNPNGIAIGKTGSVQTGGFIASTLGMQDSDFLAGNYSFTGTGGAIRNEGMIKGAVVALIAPSVTNDGALTGDTALAGGTDVLLDFNGDGLISVEVKASTLATLVENKGLIAAKGLAILTAKGASDVLKGIVNNTGTVEATSLAARNGRILLLADMREAHGEVNAAGTLKAGFVETSAAKVNLDAALKVDTQGGQWLIDPVNITIDASKASAIQTALGSGNVTVTTANGAANPFGANGTGADAGNIDVNASINWAANTLTLRADNAITVNAELTSTGTTAGDGLVLQYAQTTGTGDYTINAPVNLAAGSLFQTQYASDAAKTYTVITSLGAADSTTATDLQGINGNRSGNYVLGASIDASSTSGWNAGAGFAPIGGNNDYYARYTGTFDGLGHTISNLTINRKRPSTRYVGLFGAVGSNGVIKNVGLLGGSVTGDGYVGGLVGGNFSGTLANAYATGSVVGAYSVGGLVGSNHEGTLTNAYATGSVAGIYDVGGLVGDSYYGTFANAYATGSVAGNYTVGGLVGRNGYSTLTNAYATGSVAGYYFVGGLVGVNYEGTLANAYATGSVTGDGTVGGLVGINYYGTLTNAYATGSVTGSSRVGGLVGDSYYGTFANAYATGSVTGDFEVGGLVGVNYLATFTNAYATGSVAGNYSVGGLVGINYYGTLTNAYATGSVAGIYYVGGLVGVNYYGTLANAYATGSVTGDFDVGGLVGVNLSGTLTNSFWDTQTSGQATSAGGTGLTTAQMKNPFTFIDVGWDFASVWGKSSANENKGYMMLRGVGPEASLYTDYVHLSNTNTSNIYGEANPSLAGISLTGLGTANVSLAWNSSITSISNAGSYAYSSGSVIDVSTTSAGGVYADYGSGALTIDPRILSLTGARTYDGSTALSSSLFTLGNLVGSQTLTLSGTGSMATKDVGNGKAVTLGTLALGNGANGGLASNYTLVGGTHLASIAQATLTLQNFAAANKTYDGNTAASIANAGILAGVVSGDGVAASNIGATFDSKNAGAGKTVTLNGVTLTGADAGNYSIASTAITQADIAQATLTLQNFAAANKTYDGNTAANIANAGVLAGVASGDGVAASNTGATFDSKNAGAGKTVTLNGVTLTGADAGNYSIASTAITQADIAQAVITAITGITAQNKSFDGNTTATVDASNAAATGLIAGDDLRLATITGSFADANPGQGKVVTLGGITFAGQDAGNYVLTAEPVTVTADITAISQPPLTPRQSGSDSGNEGCFFSGSPALSSAIAVEPQLIDFGGPDSTEEVVGKSSENEEEAKPGRKTKA